MPYENFSEVKPANKQSHEEYLKNQVGLTEVAEELRDEAEQYSERTDREGKRVYKDLVEEADRRDSIRRARIRERLDIPQPGDKKLISKTGPAEIFADVPEEDDSSDELVEKVV